MKCTVVTPIGPGHQDLYQECAASILRAQQHSPGPFDEITLISVDDTQGKGRSRARNLGISRAREAGADWILFIDADDVLLENTFAVVADYVGEHDAIWGLIVEQRPPENAPAIRNPQARRMNNLMELPDKGRFNARWRIKSASSDSKQARDPAPVLQHD